MKTNFFLPTKQYTLTDALNRHFAATGSVSGAAASANADFNGHAIGMEWNDYRRYYVVSYTWAGQVVVCRDADPRRAIAAAIAEYDRQGKGASLGIALLDEHLAVADEFPQLLAWSVEAQREADSWRTDLYGQVGEAVWCEKHWGMPTSLLLQAENLEDYKIKCEAWQASRPQGSAVYGSMVDMFGTGERVEFDTPTQTPYADLKARRLAQAQVWSAEKMVDLALCEV